MMVFLAIWLRRSNVLTGAEWITFRFGNSRGSRWSHIITVVFAIIIVIAFMAYFVEGMGKFAAQFLPWDLSWSLAGLTMSTEDSYALIIIGITTFIYHQGRVLQRCRNGSDAICHYDDCLYCRRDHCLFGNQC